MPKRESESCIVIGGFILYCLIWGVSYSMNSIAIRHIPPFLLGGIRYNLAAIPLMVIIAVRKQWPNRATAFQLIKLSWFTVSGPGLFTLYGMQFLPSGFTSLIWASCPIFVIVFGLLRGEEQISWAKGFGAGLSFFGLYFLVSETMHTPEYLPLKGILSVLAAVVLFSIGIIRARVLTSIQKPVTIAAFQTFFGGLLMLLASAVFEDGRVINMTWSAYLAIIYLAIFPGSISFSLSYWLLSRIGTSALSFNNVVSPLVAIWIGIIVLGEQVLSLRSMLGTILIFAGLIMVLTFNRYSVRESSEKSTVLD